MEKNPVIGLGCLLKGHRDTVLVLARFTVESTTH